LKLLYRGFINAAVRIIIYIIVFNFVEGFSVLFAAVFICNVGFFFRVGFFFVFGFFFDVGFFFNVIFFFGSVSVIIG
jgi:hypothetical protein